MNNKYRFDEDSKLYREIRNLTQNEMAEMLGMGIATINRWENMQGNPSKESLEKFYGQVYLSGVRLNKIKEQFYREELGNRKLLLFHGAKSQIDGSIRCDVSRTNNDFGKGFYLGESFRQAALFVSNFETSSVYCISFNCDGLVGVEYDVNTEWMMTVACFRERLKGRISEARRAQILEKALKADYIVAPIADNRMYQIIDSFIDGEITDEQCRHALSATDLGRQYVIKSTKAASQVDILERCFLCQPEKEEYVSDRNNNLQLSEDKVRAARIKYRGKGKYIDELI